MIKLKNDNNWIIESKKNLLDIQFGDVWSYRDLLKLLVKRDFVTYYKQTILGPLWFLLQPLLTTFIFTLVFGRIGGLKTDGIPHLLFYFSGITLWNYFSESLMKCSTVFKDNAGMFNKVYFPRLIIPLSIIFSNLIKLALQLLLLFALIFYYGLNNDVNYLTGNDFWLFPFLILIIAFLALGCGMLVSALTVKYRDLSFLVSFGVQLLLFTTTVAFPLSAVKHPYSLIINLNPMTALIETFRHILFGSNEMNFNLLIYSILFSVVILILGLIAFNKVEKNFVDTV